MFGLGFQELLIIFVVALLVFGPNRLPELARTLGKSLNEFRRASSELRRSIMEPELQNPPKPGPLGAADEMATAALPPNLSPLPPEAVAAATPAPPAPAAAPPPEEPRPS
jgi:TatA/E family protein of Tat protein translocase